MATYTGPSAAASARDSRTHGQRRALSLVCAAWLWAPSLAACADQAVDGSADNTAGDSTSGDGSGGDSGAFDAADTTSACVKVAPPVPDVDAKRTRFAMSLYHFNLEYVIGGLDYTDASGKRHLFAGVAEAAGWNDAKVEDWIVTDTFAPILEMYDRHPSWGVDIELQGRFVEVLAARHPQVLDLLRRMAQRGQVELVSFHQNAQLFLAFPREDLDRSIQETVATFAAHCLPLSGVVFNQEGQAGEGRQRALFDHGYSIGIHPKNLFRYAQKGEDPFWPWYQSEGATLIAGPGSVDPKSGVEVAWDIFDDGELFAVPSKLNPYFAPITKHDPKVVAALEAKLQAREDAGFLMATVSQYVLHLAKRGVEKKQAPPLLDGTWQAPSTDSIHRWLGGRSDVFADGESDNNVRTANVRARREVIAAQVLLEVVQKQGKVEPALAGQVHGLWRRLFRAQVSDGSGVNPWIGERMACLDESAAIVTEAKPIHAALLAKLGWKHAEIDVEARTAQKISEIPQHEPPTVVDAPLPVTVTTGDRKAEVQWTLVGPKRWQLNVSFDKAGSGPACAACDPRHVQVDFPRADAILRYSPGLLDGEVRTYPAGAFALLEGEAYLPLANGLLGLGQDRWVIKHTAACHIAVRIADGDASASFIDRSLQPSDTGAWAFELFEGPQAEALALARRINTHPRLYR